MKFEKITTYNNVNINLPQRKTANSAGYDFEVAEDTVVPAYDALVTRMTEGWLADDRLLPGQPLTLNQVAENTKKTKAKPTLVPTGVKCKLDPNTYLELSVRSSCPLKYWLLLANSVGRL